MHCPRNAFEPGTINDWEDRLPLSVEATCQGEPLSRAEMDRGAEEADDAAMARTTITQITDDIDGSKDAEEVAFSFMGTDYTIDLAKKNRAAFEKAMKPYVDAGTRVSRRSRAGSSPKKSSTRSSTGADVKAVRAWAAANGYEISTRGRVPRAVVEAYQNAQG
jgi:hypothetical protein